MYPKKTKKIPQQNFHEVQNHIQMVCRDIFVDPLLQIGLNL
jgi:hypothetical protein